MSEIRILWADDEIDLLKPQIIFLEQKGYAVEPVSNGHDALDKCKTEHFDLIFLDEHMPGISGLETLSRIKAINKDIPVVMITKNEEENIMEEAIGSQIADYLIKPVKPNQILLAIKKITENKKLKHQPRTLTTSIHQRLSKLPTAQAEASPPSASAPKPLGFNKFAAEPTSKCPRIFSLTTSARSHATSVGPHRLSRHSCVASAWPLPGLAAWAASTCTRWRAWAWRTSTCPTSTSLMSTT